MRHENGCTKEQQGVYKLEGIRKADVHKNLTANLCYPVAIGNVVSVLAQTSHTADPVSI